MRFFFLRNYYFEVPTNAGGVSYGRTGRTLERAGSGSHLDEERTVRAPPLLLLHHSCLRNQSRWIVLRDRVLCPRLLRENLANAGETSFLNNPVEYIEVQFGILLLERRKI